MGKQRNASQYNLLNYEESLDPVAVIHDMRYGINPERGQIGIKKQTSATAKTTSRQQKCGESQIMRFKSTQSA